MLLVLSLAACSLGAPAHLTAPTPALTQRPAATFTRAATRPPAATLPASTPTSARPSPTQPAPTSTPDVLSVLEKHDLAVLSPANIKNLQLLTSFRPGPQGAVAPLLFSPDHSRLIFGLASADAQGIGGAPIYIWSLAGGLPDHILQSGSPAQPILAFSSDAAYLASAGARSLQLWTTRDWQPITAPPEPLSPASALAFDSSSGRLLAASEDGLLHAWDPAAAKDNWSVQAHFPGISALAASHAGAWLASAGLDGALRLWKAASGEKERDFSRSTGVITALAFLPDDQQLISYAKDGQVGFWQVSDGKQIAQFQACSSGLPGCTPPAFSPDRRLMALSDPAAEAGAAVYIYDLQTRALWSRLDTSPLIDPTRIAALAFSPDGRLLAVGSQDGQVQIWGVPGTPFTLGAQLSVTAAGDGLNLRDRPALEGSIRSQLHSGETLHLLEGPLLAGGFNWWRALTSDGREGWIVEVPEWYEIGKTP